MRPAADPIFIYRSWQRSKMYLDEKLKLSPHQRSALNKWFRDHIFEVGVEHRIDKAAMAKSSFDLVKDARYRNSRQITDGLMARGMFMEEQVHHGTQLILTTRLLIGGANDFAP